MPPAPPPPIDINEWWLAAAAATSILAPTAAAQAATQPGTQVGITTAVRPGVVATSAGDRVVYIGNSVAYGERFKTDGTGVMHILFMDQSSMTLGPNSELVIDEFVFNPESRRGSIAVNLVKGALRVVGGFISKFNNPQGFSAARVQTTTATIGIRGGISTIENNNGNTSATFLFGQSMQVVGGDGQTRTVTRPGFGVNVGSNGVTGGPSRVPTTTMSSLLNQFGSGGTQSGGAQSPGTPGGGLISTGGRSIGNSPNTSFAPDRTQQSQNQLNTQTHQNTLRTLLGSNPTPNQS